MFFENLVWLLDVGIKLFLAVMCLYAGEQDNHRHEAIIFPWANVRFSIDVDMWRTQRGESSATRSWSKILNFSSQLQIIGHFKMSDSSKVVPGGH